MRKQTIWVPEQVRHNPPVQLQKIARSLKFRIRKKKDCTIHVAKTKVLTSFAVTVKLVCAFVFAYADCCFSYSATHLLSSLILCILHGCVLVMNCRYLIEKFILRPYHCSTVPHIDNLIARTQLPDHTHSISIQEYRIGSGNV